MTEEELKQARAVDLLSYLETCEPDELVRLSPRVYCTRTHDSLKISNGQWYWFSRGIGGVSALDYLVKVRDYDLVRAAEAVLGHRIPERKYEPVREEEKAFGLPKRNATSDIVYGYLRNRGIHPWIIRYCMDRGILYESHRYHSAVFVGTDEKNRARFACIRNTKGAYKGDVKGSDKRYAFRIVPQSRAKDLHVFESAIDLMSCITLKIRDGEDWQKDAYLSLTGVYPGGGKTGLPKALENYLERNPGTEVIHLHLDADRAGREASQSLMTGLQDRYKVLDEPPDAGKDMNECLMTRLGLTRAAEPEERADERLDADGNGRDQ